MSLPERFHRKKDNVKENDYILEDDEGNQVNRSLYKHWYGPKRYALMWEHKYSSLEIPAVYEEPDGDERYFRIHDDRLIKEISDDFWKLVSQPLQTDGSVWLYENKEPKSMGADLNTSVAGTWTCEHCNSVNSSRF